MTRGVSRIHHLVFAIKPEHFRKAIEDFSFVFGTAFYGPFVHEGRNQVAVSWDAGLELQSPVDIGDGSALSAFLKERGDGLYGFVFRVRDLDFSIERLAQAGMQPIARVNGLSGPEPWRERLSRLDEAIYAGFYGMNFALGQIEPFAD